MTKSNKKARSSKASFKEPAFSSNKCCKTCGKPDGAVSFFKVDRQNVGICKSCFVCTCKKCKKKEDTDVVFILRGYDHVTCTNCLGGVAVCRMCGVKDEGTEFSSRQRLRGAKAICMECVGKLRNSDKSEYPKLQCSACGVMEGTADAVFGKRQRKLKAGELPKCQFCIVLERQIVEAHKKVEAAVAIEANLVARLEAYRAISQVSRESHGKTTPKKRKLPE